MMDLHEAALAIGAAAPAENPHFGAVSTDTRKVGRGELFIALRGENFDGHDFVDAAAERGAIAAIVDVDWAGIHPAAIPLLVVTDTRRAFGLLAAHWRQKFEIPLIGVTGSNGKTTVKEMIAGCLRAQAVADGLDPDAAVLATSGNLNNDIGVPTMLLRLTAAHRAAVIEMGMNHPGEIAYLTRLAKPTVAVVNNAQRAHLEGMGDLAEVAREKGDIYDGLGASGVAVVNADDSYVDYWRDINRTRRVVCFGIDQPADVSANVRQQGLASAIALHTAQGEAEFVLNVPGQHNARNALAAAAAALASGVTLRAVADGLSRCVGVKGRLQLRAAAGGTQLIDDTYNANPDSMKAAIDVLATTVGRKLLVLGDMGEIGAQAGQYHDEIGGYAKSQGIDKLFALGEVSELAARNFGTGGRHFRSVDDLLAALRKELGPDTVVLVKGSRFMRMERVADAIAVDPETKVR